MPEHRATSTIDHVRSRDGTAIAYDRIGDGPLLVLVAGTLCTRRTLAPLAERLAENFTVINYDRRGRGDSGNTKPYAAEREVEDLAALIDGAGGTASMYGHSSGAALALLAAEGGLPIERLVLHEPPYGPDDDESTAAATRLAADVTTALAEGCWSDAITLFMADSGLSADAIDDMAHDPDWRVLAPSMVHDFEVVGEAHGGTVPVELAPRIAIPTLVLAGTASPEFFMDTSRRLVALLPHGQLAVLEGAAHDAPPDVVAPVVTDFLTRPACTDGLWRGRTRPDLAKPCS